MSSQYVKMPMFSGNRSATAWQKGEQLRMKLDKQQRDQEKEKVSAFTTWVRMSEYDSLSLACGFADLESAGDSADKAINEGGAWEAVVKSTDSGLTVYQVGR